MQHNIEPKSLVTHLDRINGSTESEMGIADTGHLKKEGTKMCLQNGAYPSTISAPIRSSSLIFDKNSEVLNGMRGPIWVASNCLKQNASRPTRRALDVLMKRTEREKQSERTDSCLIMFTVADITAAFFSD
jgi:hypothetical protein